MNNISLLVGLKNNLSYTKFFYNHTRSKFPGIEICFVSYGSTDGTHEWLKNLNDDNVKFFFSDKTKTLADAYNKATEISTKDYVVYAHNDMIFSQDFIHNLQPHLNPNRIIAYTTVEPPIFGYHIRPGKIVKDFGLDTESFMQEDFYNYSVLVDKNLIDWDTQDGISFFICSPKNVLMDMGGLDNLFDPFFCEDDDLIRRFKLQNLEMKICLNAFCYHFVSKTSRFSEEFQNKTQKLEYNSNRNYIRKWGCRTEAPKYNIGAEIVNCNKQILYYIEPFFSTLVVTDNALINDYINTEQNNTKIELSTKFIKEISGSKISIDADKFDNQDFSNITNIMHIIQKINQHGLYKIGNLDLHIKDLVDIQNTLLINRNN